MTQMASASRLLLEPVVRWPRRLSPGQSGLVEVDLRVSAGPGSWSLPDEEVAFACLLEGAPYIGVQSVGETLVLVHRFGGSYGPARFRITARGGTGSRSLWLTVCSRYGVPLRTDPLHIEILDTARPPAPVSAEPGTDLAEQYAAGRTPALVTVELRTDALERDRYLLAVLEKDADGQRTALLMPDDPMTMPAAMQALAETPLANSAEPLEFLVPPELLNVPFDQMVWPGQRLPVGALRPTWVRHLTHRRVHEGRAWRRRLLEMSTSGGAMSQDLIYTPMGGAPVPERAVCALLPEPPPQPVLSRTIEAGFPVMLWPRRLGSDLRDWNLLAGSLWGLPERVHAFRLAAARSGDPDHLGRHLTLYWDVDPNRNDPFPPPLWASA